MPEQSDEERKARIDALLAPRSTDAPNAPNGKRSRGGGEGMDRHLERQRFTPKRIAIGVGVLLLIALIVWGLVSTTGGRTFRVERDKITVSTVEYGPFQETISVTGNVLPRTTVFLDAVEGGRIEEIYLEEGTLVEKGQPLLRLSNNQLELQLLNTESQRIEQVNRLEQTRFQVEQNNLNLRQQLTDMDYNIRRIKRDFDRNQGLFEKGIISEQEFERTKDEYEYWTRRRDLTLRSYSQDSLRQTAQIAQMQVAVNRMDQNFAVIQERLDNLTLRAPVAGRLTQLNAELGELRTAGFRFGQIDVLDGFKVRAGVDEFYINRVGRGQQAITQPIAGTEYLMEIRRVYPEVREGRFEVDLDFADAVPPGIRRGQTIRFRLEMSDAGEAVILPIGGFYQSSGGNWAYVVSGDEAHRREIRLGRKNPQVFEVIEGLEPGEQVVTSSYDTFGDADILVFK